MILTYEQRKAITVALRAKMRACSSCGAGDSWVLVDKFHLLNLTGEPSTIIPPDATIPCVVLYCKECGLVHLYNIHQLPGLGEKLGVPAPGRGI